MNIPKPGQLWKVQTRVVVYPADHSVPSLRELYNGDVVLTLQAATTIPAGSEGFNGYYQILYDERVYEVLNVAFGKQLQLVQ